MQTKLGDGNIWVTGFIAKDAEYKLVGDKQTSFCTFGVKVSEKDGSDGKKEAVYGYVVEYVEADNASTQLSEITASPSPIELNLLPAPETQLISVVGSRGVMYSEVGILNTDCTFASDAPAVAAVDAAGLITAVSDGDAVITVTHKASELTDTIDVTVTDNA